MGNDDQTITYIVRWFLDQNLMLGFEQVGEEWRALIIPDDSRVNFILQGAGQTKLEAAEDAKRRWEAGQQHGQTVTIGPAIETDEAMPLAPKKGSISSQVTIGGSAAVTRVGGNPPTVKVEVPAGGVGVGGVGPGEKIELPSAPELIAKLEAYEQGVLFADEPGGEVRAYLANLKTGEVIRSSVEADLIDAYLGLGIDFQLPSEEGRKGRAGDVADPRG